jgi:hypothetical protein
MDENYPYSDGVMLLRVQNIGGADIPTEKTYSGFGNVLWWGFSTASLGIQNN